MTNRFRRAGALLSIALFAACASSGTTTDTPQAATGAGSDAVIRIDNNRPNATVITVFIEPDVGARRQLGTVEPNQQGSFNYAAQTGNHRLIAQPLTGNDIQSEQFRLAQGQIASWNMQTNRVLVRNR